MKFAALRHLFHHDWRDGGDITDTFDDRVVIGRWEICHYDNCQEIRAKYTDDYLYKNSGETI